MQVLSKKQCMDTIDLFSQFPFEKELRDEISETEILEFKSGTVILREHQYIKVIPLILEGSVKLRKTNENGREIVFYHISPGQSCILSITSCLNGKESQAEAVVEDKTRLIGLDAAKVRDWMDRFPGWRKFVVSLYYDRMTELMTLVDLITFKSVDQRLFKYLSDRAVNNIVEITHQKLAGEIGTAREVISRLLKQMEKDNLIVLERGRIIIL
jgi:CRP/FNR family transcriptional regulator, anaerobic regulatory protein